MRIFIVSLILLFTNILDQTFAAVTTPPFEPMNAVEIFIVRFGYVNVPSQGNQKRFLMSMILKPKKVSDRIKLRKKKKPRCGAKDILKKQNVSKWNKMELKYKIVGPVTPYLTRSKVREAIKDAFNYWAEVTPLTFTEVFGEEKSDFIIKFGRYEHSDPFPFDGKNGVLAHAYSPEDGRIHFDSDDYFTEGLYLGYNLRVLAAHEIGHALGLSHSKNKHVLMAPKYGGYIPKGKPLLKEEDIRNIQRIYGPNVKTTAPSLPKTSATRRFKKLFTKKRQETLSKNPKSTVGTTTIIEITTTTM